MEVFFTDEVEEKVGYTNQHIRRFIKDGKVDLIENEDYRIGRNGQYLFADTALEKFIAYSKENHRRRKKKDEAINP